MYAQRCGRVEDKLAGARDESAAGGRPPVRAIVPNLGHDGRRLRILILLNYPAPLLLFQYHNASVLMTATYPRASIMPFGMTDALTCRLGSVASAIVADQRSL